MLLRFLRDRRGSILPTFAIALIPLVVATGGVVDYTNAFDQRTLVQDALDSAALAAGKQVGLVSSSEVEAIAESFYLANVGTGKISNIPELTTSIDGSTVDVNTTLHVPTYFLGIIGLDEFVFNLHAQVTIAMGTIEIAMALDNSGSMAGSKIGALKQAANNLVAQLHSIGATSTKPDPVKIGVAPFAASVNVGPGYANAAWMDTVANGTYHADAQKGYGASATLNNFTLFSNLKNFNNQDISWGGCVEERPFPYDTDDTPASAAGTPTAEEKKTLFVPMFSPDDPDPWTCSTSSCDYEGNSSSTRRYNGAPSGGQSRNNYLPDAGTAATCGNVFTVTEANPAVFTRAGHGLTAGTDIVLATTGSLYTGLTAGETYTVAATGLTANTFELVRSNTFTVTRASPAVFTSNNHGLSAGSEVVFSTTGSLYTGLTAGETYIVASSGLSSNNFRVLSSTNFTVTEANPAVFTSNGHGLTEGAELVFSTTGSLYTGLTAGQSYYVAPTGLTANTFQVSPQSSNPTFTVNRRNPATFTSNGHGLTVGTAVTLTTTGDMYDPLTEGTIYYVVWNNTNKFRVSETPGGSILSTAGGGSQSGTHRWTRLAETTGSQSGTHSYGSLVATSGSQWGTHSFESPVATSGSQSGVHTYSVGEESANWTCQSGNADCGGAGIGKSEEIAFAGLNNASGPQCKYGTPDNKATISNVSVGGIPAGPNFMCTTNALSPLTTSQSAITLAINNQLAQGATNITSGIMWGWRILSPGEPFTEGRPYADGENQKILIVMTDGANTYYPNNSMVESWYGAWGYTVKDHLETGSTSPSTSTLVSKMNERTALACENVKAAGIWVYTIAFDVDDDDTLDMMEACATLPEMAFQSGNNSELLAAFAAIGDDISLLRIAQ